MSVRWRNGALGIDQRHDADLPEEPRGHRSRSSASAARVRIGGVGRQQDRALGVRRADTRTTPRSRDASYGTTVGLRLRPPALLRQRDRHAARRGARRSRRPRRAALARGADRRVPLGARRRARRPAAGVDCRDDPSLGHRRRGRPARRRHPGLALQSRLRRRAHRRATARSARTSTSATTSSSAIDVKIQNNVSVYDAVTLEDDVFCGPSMVFTNVYNPRAAVTRKNEYRPRSSGAARRWAPTARWSAA